MSREWQPGDVAIVLNEWGVWNRAICAIRSGHRGFVWSYGVADSVSPLSAEARPLVVIDREDAEQVGRLCDLFDQSWGGCAGGTHGAIGTALRAYVAYPPKPEEPQGLGAVVRDAQGDVWVRRDGPASGSPWLHAKGMAFGQRWAGLDIPDESHILSHGVSPEEAS